jgi:hypothetical protein
LLKQALAENLVAAAGDPCLVEPIPDASSIREKEFVILTISSYLFRMVVLSYFSPDEATTEHFAKLIKTRPKEMDRKGFYDAISEFGNRFCGSLNRAVGRHFPHVGMSTPNILARDCIGFLNALGAEHVRHFKVTVNPTTSFHASLCVCDYGNLDFALESASLEESTGELELF